jgi:hypothetical protein
MLILKTENIKRPYQIPSCRTEANVKSDFREKKKKCKGIPVTGLGGL